LGPATAHGPGSDLHTVRSRHVLPTVSSP